MTPSTKLGGLPVWAWGLVALAGIGLGLYLRRRSGGNSGTSLAAAIPSTTPLGAASGGGSSATDAGAGGLTQSAMDPYLASLIGDSQLTLVNESNILAGLAGQSLDTATGLASQSLGIASDLFASVRAMAAQAPVVYNIGSSPVASSTAGLETPSPAAVAQSVATPTPAPAAPAYTPPPAPSAPAFVPPSPAPSADPWVPPSDPIYGADYQPEGNVIDSNTIEATTYTVPVAGGPDLVSPGGGTYTGGGGLVYFQPNVGKFGKKPLY